MLKGKQFPDLDNKNFHNERENELNEYIYIHYLKKV